ncbi:MAG TPA: MFS transporter, partial [Steroidobacteraceae bacterium]|nr:MFS transporter [Steroidobacteraceae bacterium]
MQSRGFSRYLAASACGSVAAEMQSLAIGWQVYQQTGSFAQLGLIGLAQFAPFALLMPLAGPVADRHDRARILMLCVLLQLIGSVLLLALAHSGTQRTWPIYGVL